MSLRSITGPDAYVGLYGGYGWGHSDFSEPFAGSTNLSGGLVGGTLGYNWQVGQAVIGLETDLGWSSIRGSASCGAGFNCETRNNWLGTTRVRLGYAADRFMPYVTGGVAYGGVKTSVAGYRQLERYQGWLDTRRRRRSCHRRTVDRQARISLCRSRPRGFCTRLAGQFSHQYRARRSQLPLLIQIQFEQNAKPRSSLRGFRVM